jgi:hypothetical protein
MPVNGLIQSLVGVYGDERKGLLRTIAVAKSSVTGRLPVIERSSFSNVEK